MAKKVVNKSVTSVDKPNNSIQEFDQAAIEAALAGAVTMGDGSPVQSLKNETKPTQEPTDECTGKPDPLPQDEKSKATDEPIASDQKKFGEDCFNFNIDAKKCHYQSTKHEDKSILEYVRAINKKIYDETCLGGFSTNVQFRVTPQDWVNVSHIMDWYRAGGFEVIVKETTSSAYGKDVGTMNHNFTISWATAN